MNIISSTRTKDKIPSDILELNELKKIAPYIPPDILFETTSFAYWNRCFINTYGKLYLKELRELDNNIQRYIVFCWMIGCCLWKWNESIFDHEVQKPFCDFDKTDWDRASDTILYLVSCGMG